MSWKNRQWNDLGNGRKLYVLEDFPNIFNGNSYLLATPEALLVIDHGGTRERAAEIERIVTEYEGSGAGRRPLAALITHCHWDHLGGLLEYTPEFRRRLTVIFHEETPECLARTDADYTCAGIYGAEVPQIPADLLLFSADQTSCGPFSARMDGTTCQLLCGGVIQLTAIQAPGHAPDSLFFKFDGCCLINDTLFGLNPGVVGQPGWHAGHFKRSVRTLLKLAEEEPECVFCVGHGSNKNAAELVPALQTLLERTDLYRNAPPVTIGMISQLKDFSQMLLSESERLFAIIAGRLFRLAFELELQGEPGQARELEQALDFTGIETQLARFRQSLERAKDAEPPALIALRGIRTVEKISAIMADKRLDQLIGPSLLRRTSTLLHDFANSVAGIPLQREASEFELNEAVDSFLKGLQKQGTPDPGADALHATIARLAATGSVFSKVTFRLLPAEGEVRVTTSKERFFDAIQHFLEQLAVAGAQKITVEVIRNGLWITPEPFHPAGAAKLQQGLCGRFLAELGCRSGSSATGYVILL